MNDYCARAACFGMHANFLDATEEEVADLLHSLLQELSIKVCFVAMPAERRKTIKQAIAVFETYLTRQYPNLRLGLTCR